MAIVPAAIQAGDSLTLEYSNTDYPASVWTLAAYLRGPSTANVAFAANSDAFAATVTPATTALWAAGTYRYSVVATYGSSVVTVETGYTIVSAAIGSIVAPVDNRSHVKRVLDAIEATIEGRATTDQQRVKIGERELEKIPLMELHSLRMKYSREYTNEQIAAGLSSALGTGNKVRVRL